jgi:Fe-S cluster assembly ATP-binding protein
MLEVKDLNVSVDDKEILKDIELTIKKGETHVLMGPNACGKTSLVMAILGFPRYRVTSGKIFFKGEDITGKEISERAKMGIASAFQTPPEVRGVKLRDILKFTSKDEDAPIYYLQRVGLDPFSFLSRDVNLGFSGGEKKRSELAQVFSMRAELMILDEPDSGVDIDSLKLIGNEIRKTTDELGSGVLVITHHRHILQYLKVDLCHIMYEGRIFISGPPQEIVPLVEEQGYEEYIKGLGGQGEP